MKTKSTIESLESQITVMQKQITIIKQGKYAKQIAQFQDRYDQLKQMCSPSTIYAFSDSETTIKISFFLETWQFGLREVKIISKNKALKYLLEAFNLTSSIIFSDDHRLKNIPVLNKINKWGVSLSNRIEKLMDQVEKFENKIGINVNLD